MVETGFRAHLKRMGKKDHVVEGLISQVRFFETFLACRHIRLAAAAEHDLQAYVNTLGPGEVKKRMRGLALYFAFAGRPSLAKAAGSLRERGIAQTRQAFKLRHFRGVNAQDVARLEALGIVTVDHMLTAGKTPQARRRLSALAGIAEPVILELVKLSDLSRLGAVKAVRARLYFEAGLDTPDKFARWEPEALRQTLIEFVERTGFKGIAPLPKELRNAIARARQLPPAVEY